MTMEDKRQMLNIFKVNPSWTLLEIADEFNKTLSREVKENTIS